jgi:hypothetical protein
MRIEYQLHSRDYLESSSLHSPNAVARFFYGLLCIQVGWYILGMALGLLGTFHWKNLLSLMPQILIWLGIIEIQKTFYRRRLIALWKDENPMDHSVAAEIDETGILFEEPISTTNQSWETFRNIKESKESFLMFVSKRRFYIVPKRAFDGGSDLAIFRQLIVQKIPKSKRGNIT